MNKVKKLDKNLNKIDENSLKLEALNQLFEEFSNKKNFIAAHQTKLHINKIINQK